MYQPERLPDGKIRVPRRADPGNGSRLIADGLITLGPGDPGYQAWDAWLRANSSESK